MNDKQTNGNPSDKSSTINSSPKTKNSHNNPASLVGRLAEIGISLSSEHNLDKLLEKIVSEALDFTNADGGTLYMVEDGKLNFTISHNTSLGIKLGGATGGPVQYPPIPMDPSFASAYAAIKKKTVSINDVYDSKEFDFSGPKKFDQQTGYRCVSMLVTPLMNHQDEVIGVLQLLNAMDQESGEIVPFDGFREELARSLASQAAVAINNFQLVKETEELFEAFLKVMATALDARSKYTHGHVRRVAGLTLELADAINKADSGPFKDVHFSEEEINEIRISGLMHDIGKIITPPHIMDKSVKLETIFDRSELIKTRYELVKNNRQASGFKKLLEMRDSGADEKSISDFMESEVEAVKQIEEEREFVLQCNNPGEFMETEKIEKLHEISKKKYEMNGESYPLITDDELLNLTIKKGSITEAERKIMQDHIVITIRMLAQIPFTKKLKNVPEYAGSHHECLDGSGYPRGLTGDQMPLQSRMLAITDFLEALTAADRPYKKAMPLDLVFKILFSEVDKGHLDRDILELIRDKEVFQSFQKKDEAGEINL